MSVISWNCRGLGNPNAVPNLKFKISCPLLQSGYPLFKWDISTSK